MIVDAIRYDGAGPFLEKDPRARLPVQIDWSAWLTQEGTTIGLSTWEASAGLTIDTQAATSTIATAWILGGVAGQVYTLRNTITGANGVIDSRSLRVVVRDR